MLHIYVSSVAQADILQNFSIRADVDGDGYKEVVAVRYDKENFTNLVIFRKHGKVIWRRRGVGDVELLVRDVSGDHRPELLYHEFYGGSSGYGRLVIYQLGNIPPRALLDEEIYTDVVLWDTEKMKIGLSQWVFQDFDHDGISEIIVHGERRCTIHSLVDEPGWWDLYKWNGKHFELGTTKVPKFVVEQRKEYREFVREHGSCPSVKEYLRRLRT